MKIKIVAAFIILAFLILFIVQNVASVEIQFLAWSVKVSRALLLLIVLAVGILLGWIMNTVHHFQKRKKEHESSSIEEAISSSQ